MVRKYPSTKYLNSITRRYSYMTFIQNEINLRHHWKGWYGEQRIDIVCLFNLYVLNVLYRYDKNVPFITAKLLWNINSSGKDRMCAFTAFICSKQSFQTNFCSQEQIILR